LFLAVGFANALHREDEFFRHSFPPIRLISYRHPVHPWTSPGNHSHCVVLGREEVLSSAL
jgi:hypothetical protein